LKYGGLGWVEKDELKTCVEQGGKRVSIQVRPVGIVKHVVIGQIWDMSGKQLKRGHAVASADFSAHLRVIISVGIRENGQIECVQPAGRDSQEKDTGEKEVSVSAGPFRPNNWQGLPLFVVVERFRNGGGFASTVA
jgi:hypothetical protein